MITFKDFLAESRSAPLYHGTGISEIESILKSNSLLGARQRFKHPVTRDNKVIFVTRSLKHAEAIVDDMFISGGVIIELSQAKLTQRYKIRPLKHHNILRQEIMTGTKFPYTDEERREAKLHLPYYMGNVSGNEFEEAILTKRIDNISQYITKIIAYDNYHMETILPLANKLGIKVLKR